MGREEADVASAFDSPSFLGAVLESLLMVSQQGNTFDVANSN